jgi:hypothetical protein
MTDHLTAGEFQAATGLSAKALRLYVERGILTPAWVDPGSGYRYFSRDQLQHGVMVDLLRRAAVPLAELAGAGNFSFDRWRDALALRRHLEDFSLDVAERVSRFDPEDYSAHSTPTDPLDWVGVVIELGIPEDAEGRIDAFAGLSVNVPAVEAALGAALADSGVGLSMVCWTAVPDTGIANAGGQMLLARAVRAGFSPKSGPAPVELARIQARVFAETGQAVRAVCGTLPSRVEVTFTAAPAPASASVSASAAAPGTTAASTAASAAESEPVQEAAEGYLHLLAFEHYLAQNALTALRPTARQVVRGPSLFAGEAPVGTFDVARPTHPLR